MNRYGLYELLVLLGSVISSFCGVLNLLIIYDMGIWNSFIFLITAMTLFQLMYDLSFYPNMMCDQKTTCYNISLLFQTYGGLTQALISNEIAFIAFYTISKRKIYDALKHGIFLMTIANIPALALVIALFIYIATGNEEAFNVGLVGYFYLRWISIFFITITCSMTLYIAWSITKHDSHIDDHQPAPLHQQVIIKKSPSKAIWALSRRLLYYPFVQVLARFGLSWYEWQYGFQFNRNDASDSRFALQCIFATTTPLGAVGYLIIFLIMQPNALNFLMARVYTCRRYSDSTFLRKEKEKSSMEMSLSSKTTDSYNRSLWAAHNPAPSDSRMYSSSQKEESSATLFNYDNLDDEELLQCIVAKVNDATSIINSSPIVFDGLTSTTLSPIIEIHILDDILTA